MVQIFPFFLHSLQRFLENRRPFSHVGQSVSTHRPFALGRGGHWLLPDGLLPLPRRRVAAAWALMFMHFHPVMYRVMGCPQSGHRFGVTVPTLGHQENLVRVMLGPLR